MVTTPSMSISMVSCGFMLCLSLSNITQADEYRNYDPCAEIPGLQPNPMKCGEKTQRGIHIIVGEILHMKGTNLLVKQTDGEEVLLRIDLYTQLDGQIRPGNRIVAKVNGVECEKHVLSINKTQ
jgi:hypothetical protein